MKSPLNKLTSFFSSQAAQIKEGGICIFYGKIKKSLDFLCSNFLAPAAVCVKIDWPKAYYFVWIQQMKRYREVCSKPDQNLIEKTRLEKVILDCIEKYMAYPPHRIELPLWIEASSTLFSLSYTQESFEKAIGTLRNLERGRDEIIRNHQFNELDFEFIPRPIAYGSIGVWENVEAYIKIGLLNLKKSKELVLLFDPKSRSNNPCYLKYWSQYITVISDPLLIQMLSPLEEFMTVPINYYMSFQSKVMLSTTALGIVRKIWDEEKKPALLKLSEDDFERGWKCLTSLGVPKDVWFVCLHVRESGWNDNNITSDFRNADIKTYEPAIRAIVEAGGWIIRMGDSGMTPLAGLEHVIDYAHSEVKSDWMDIFLCSQCRFLIGTSSGVHTISSAFGVPVVMTNCLPIWALYQFSGDDIFLPRLCLSKDDGHYLSFNDLMIPPFSTGAEQHVYDRLNLKAVENTPEEIRDAVMEMLMRIEGTMEYSQEDQSLQEQFRSLSSRCGQLYGDSDIIVNASIGRDFLRKHSSLLPSGKQSGVSTKV